MRRLPRSSAEALLSAAREEGYQAARLDTLATTSEAQALYRSLRFHEIAPYYENPLPGVVYMEVVLCCGRARPCAVTGLLRTA